MAPLYSLLLKIPAHNRALHPLEPLVKYRKVERPKIKRESQLSQTVGVMQGGQSHFSETCQIFTCISKMSTISDLTMSHIMIPGAGTTGASAGCPQAPLLCLKGSTGASLQIIFHD